MTGKNKTSRRIAGSRIPPDPAREDWLMTPFEWYERKDAEANFRAGDMTALLISIYWSARLGKPIELWAAVEFCKAFEKVMHHFGASSWDDVFGKPLPGAKLSALQKERQLRRPVYYDVRRLRAQKPKPKNIFRTVAAKYEISERTAKRYFDGVCHELEQSRLLGETAGQKKTK